MLIPLAPRLDLDRPLANPDKGWFHHQVDDHVRVYPASAEDLSRVTGLDHLYFRIPWNAFEPKRGEYRWDLIEEPMKALRARGVGFGLGIVAKETNDDSAVPEWAVAEGIKGRWVESGWSRDFEPDPADPVFLRNLQRLYRAIAARYAKDPALRYVDLRSYGDWGEGHTSFGSKTRATADVLGRQIALFADAFPKTLKMVSDDWVTSAVPDDQSGRVRDEFLRRGFSFRDDSPGVRWYVDRYPEFGSVRSPELFEAVWRKRPTLLELQHYAMMRDPARDHTWPTPDTVEWLDRAISVTHCTWIGYHGWAADFVRENPTLMGRVLNRVGYWFSPESLEREGDRVRIAWRNRGVAPAYRPYRVEVRVGERVFRTAWDPRRWTPGETTTETLLAPGRGPVAVRIRTADGRPVEIAVRSEYRDSAGFYRLDETSEN